MMTAEKTPTNRRDLLSIVTGAAVTVGLAAAAWPLINQLNPGSDVAGPVDIDLLSIPEGQEEFLKWANQPWLVRHRTAQELILARTAFGTGLRDPLARNANFPEKTVVTFENRAIPGDPRFVVLSAICTRPDCVIFPDNDDRGHASRRWYCPCCGSRFDSNGCVWYGPAPANLPIPRYAMLGRSKIRVESDVHIWR